MITPSRTCFLKLPQAKKRPLNSGSLALNFLFARVFDQLYWLFLTTTPFWYHIKNRHLTISHFSNLQSQIVCPNLHLLTTLFTSYLQARFISLEEKLSTFSASILIIASLIHQHSATNNALPDLTEPKPNTLLDNTSGWKLHIFLHCLMSYHTLLIHYNINIRL